MTITLIHPSRGRPEKSVQNTMRWIERAGMPVELIVSIDADDDVNAYINSYSRNWLLDPHGPVKKMITINHNSSVVQATNEGMKHSTGDIIIYLCEDFDCPKNWAELVLKEFEDATGPRLIKVDDMLQPFHVPVLTIPMMNRALYERLGYFFHPDFKSMHCDEHLYQVAMKLKAIKLCPHLKFEHKHVSVGKAEDDDTYRRSAANWNHGKATLDKHKRMGFPV